MKFIHSPIDLLWLARIIRNNNRGCMVSSELNAEDRTFFLNCGKLPKQLPHLF